MARTAGRPRKAEQRISVSIMDAALNKLAALPVAGVPDLDYVKLRAELWDERFAESRTVEEIVAFLVEEVPDMSRERATAMVSAAHKDHLARVAPRTKTRVADRRPPTQQLSAMGPTEADSSANPITRAAAILPRPAGAGGEAFSNAVAVGTDEVLSFVPNGQVERTLSSNAVPQQNREGTEPLAIDASVARTRNSDKAQQPSPQQDQWGTQESSSGASIVPAPATLFGSPASNVSRTVAPQIVRGDAPPAPFRLRTDVATGTAQTSDLDNPRNETPGAPPALGRERQQGPITSEKRTGVDTQEPDRAPPGALPPQA